MVCSGCYLTPLPSKEVRRAVVAWHRHALAVPISSSTYIIVTSSADALNECHGLSSSQGISSLHNWHGFSSSHGISSLHAIRILCFDGKHGPTCPSCATCHDRIHLALPACGPCAMVMLHATFGRSSTLEIICTFTCRQALLSQSCTYC